MEKALKCSQIHWNIKHEVYNLITALLIDSYNDPTELDQQYLQRKQMSERVNDSLSRWYIKEKKSQSMIDVHNFIKIDLWFMQNKRKSDH